VNAVFVNITGILPSRILESKRIRVMDHNSATERAKEARELLAARLDDATIERLFPEFNVTTRNKHERQRRLLVVARGASRRRLAAPERAFGGTPTTLKMNRERASVRFQRASPRLLAAH